MSEIDEKTNPIDAEDALTRLQQGNARYLVAAKNEGDISPEIRKDTTENGQHPFATVVTCADSRVVPEHVFMAGLGELFCVRVAGNAINESQLGSIEYAAGPGEGPVAHMLAPIRAAIGDEQDDYAACCLNVRAAVDCVNADALVAQLVAEQGFRVVGAVYHIDSGEVEFLEEC